MSMNNPLTPAGIEPATFRFVAQHLNHCATAVPKDSQYPSEFEGKVFPSHSNFVLIARCENTVKIHGLQLR